jgi:hypothetical protein
MKRLILALAAAVSVSVAGAAEKSPGEPYVDPGQLDVPWPKHSDYKQPWRGFLETKSGYDFLHGIGINYQVPGNDELAVRLLAEAGFKTFRIEIGFGSVRWDRAGLNNEDRMRRLLRLCKQYTIRPTFLLNAHQGAPCPVQFFKKRLVEDASRGSRTIKLADTRGLVIGRSGVNGLTDYWAAEALITALDAKTGQCELSKPLPKDLKAGDLPLATLAYLPLYPVGTKEFDETASGWVDYAMMVCQLAHRAGIDEFDVEIWNELTFGTRFLDINNYYDPQSPKAPRGPHALHEGGRCWELARRTIEAVQRQYPKARCIWGFSNTTFFDCPIAKLPPGTAGQSYHPYGTGTRSLPRQEYQKDHPELNLEGFTPTIDIRMPEGWAHTFLQTESLMRHLNPDARRKQHPPGVERFYHYITEHGVAPAECGIHDADQAWNLKTLCLTRSLCLWLNKGVDAMHYFTAYDAKPLGMGLLPVDLPKLAPQSKFDQVATPPLRVLRNLTGALADSVPLEKLRPLSVDVSPLGEQKMVFAGDARHPPLWHRDVVAVLPFQIRPDKFALVVYVMTYDATRPLGVEEYRLAIRGLSDAKTTATLYDPQEETTRSLPVAALEAGPQEMVVPLTDHPRLLILQPSQPAAAGSGSAKP